MPHTITRYPTNRDEVVEEPMVERFSERVARRYRLLGVVCHGGDFHFPSPSALHYTSRQSSAEQLFFHSQQVGRILQDWKGRQMSLEREFIEIQS